MIVTWEVDNNYDNTDIQYKTEIPDFVLDGCESKLEREMVIDEYVQADFEKEITWYIKKVK